ncbi:MAG TPA: alpha-hydroxy acid oxidase [Acidimicrobiia bacterium]|nr:alpha-hydroxy acid oxidase [Acidimicrobiia bacterium]
MVNRRLLRWSDMSPLLARPERSGTRRSRRMSRAASIEDLRRLARRRAPRAVFDYVDGGADDEVTLRRSRTLFRDLEFQPKVLQDVSHIDTSGSFLGVPSEYPFGFAPTGFTRMMHHEGEPAVARVAKSIGIPYALATMGTTSPEVLARAAPGADLWFQLYVWRDRATSLDLVERARHAGFRALVLTVDLPVGGNRRRDVRNGLSVPPNVSTSTILDAALHPRWWFDLLTTPPLRFATLASTDGTIADSADRLFDPSLTVEALDWLREQWDGPIIVKGIQTTADALRVVDAGADAVVLSNHGGRQLDRSPAPLMLVGATKEALGTSAEVYLDGGVMNGADIVAAIALGADGVLVGRAYLYGLMAGGEDGVRRVADLLTADIVRTMALLGVGRVADLEPEMVRLP